MTDDKEFAALLFRAIGKDTGNNKIINKIKARCLYNTGPFIGKDPEMEHNPHYIVRVNGWQEICAWLLFNIKQGEKIDVSTEHSKKDK